MVQLKNIVCGCEPSGTNPGDVEYVHVPNVNAPASFDTDVCGDVINQGVDGSCVSQCLYEMVRYSQERWSHSRRCPISREWVYDRRRNKGVQGMTPREGMEILRTSGLVSLYARIPSFMEVRAALIGCGPILTALPVYDATDQFWRGVDAPVGYHAVTVTAFDPDGFTFKNTWGADWGSYGYGYIPIDDFDKIVESWVILK